MAIAADAALAAYLRALAGELAARLIAGGTA
jgi:hypothetical protein